MRLRLLSAALLATAVASAGCTRAGSSTDYRNNSGAVALSSEDALVYVADSDNGTLSVVDAEKRTRLADIKVGRNPEHVVVGPDDTIYVSNRGSRSISVIRRNEWTAPIATIAVGVEPYAMALADDGKTLLVVNSTALDSSEYGTLMGIDTSSLQPTFEIAVGDEPRGVTVSEGYALVSLSRKGQIVRVNLATRAIEGSATNISELASRNEGGLAPFENDFLGRQSFGARSMVELTTTPDGTRSFSTVVWSSDSVLDGPNADKGGGGASYGGGPCGVGGVASAGALTIDTRSLVPSVDPLTSCGFNSPSDFPAPIMADSSNGHLQGPTAIVVDPTGQWLFVVNKESNNVAVMPTNSRPLRSDGSTITMPVVVPGGPVGIAITRDSKRAWVYSLFAHQLVSIEATETNSNTPVLQASSGIVIATDVFEDPDVAEGRKLFFSATDSRMNTIGIACATCHVDAREDGHVWNFSVGPRQTPSLAGRNLGGTAPYHWNGEFPSFNDFVSHTITARMGGHGVSNTMERQLLRYIDSVAAPDNPYVAETPTEAQVRGAQVFQKANCNSCHAGANFTDNRNVDVGTLVRNGTVAETLPLNTPSLLSLARTGPFLHDGSAPTLEARIRVGKDANLHGDTKDLSEGEVTDLVAYLKSL